MGWFDRLLWRRPNPPVSVLRIVDLPGRGTVAVARSIDCLGEMCPRPQLLTVKVVGEIGVGEVVEVLTDNAAAAEGFPALAMKLDCEHLASVRETGHWRIYLRRSA
ncbi:MAG: sulfurtransferase TusA family protein [Lautropia sp.]|mgnify:FL=1|nr:MAG: sulfurtransferase TusA family protein [Pseudomonadota bacterium]MBC6959303.1 sulfurtransferase TusA family protein [Lautropia sp.]MCL4701290.1 sulfurtransferase TusA family protein [Burkholderiaceae bacterium]MDL1907431.1 sulfurtransferase TusA family protein [Betaproteobacteria bacterium PRO1]MEB2335397.1 sulfurtransferase TusA family protein [Burkholderiales bacterium]